MPTIRGPKLRRATYLFASCALTLICVALIGEIYGHPFAWDVKRTAGQWVANSLTYIAVAALAIYVKKRPDGAPVAAGMWIALGVAILLTGICATG